jgi:hypothetical protein
MTTAVSLFNPPATPPIWNVGSYESAKKYYFPLKFWGTVLGAIGTVGIAIATYKMAALYFTAKIIVPSLALQNITYIALLSFGRYMRKMADRHIPGLTKENFLKLQSEVIALRFQNLGKAFEKVPNGKQRDQIDGKLRDQVDKGFGSVFDSFMDLAVVYLFV